jgi:predicted branched-subunit amino acid permease
VPIGVIVLYCSLLNLLLGVAATALLIGILWSIVRDAPARRAFCVGVLVSGAFTVVALFTAFVVYGIMLGS